MSSTNRCFGWRWSRPSCRPLPTCLWRCLRSWLWLLLPTLHASGKKTHHVLGLFQHINGQHASIAFTVEEQDSEGNLSMLYVMWSRTGEKISTYIPPHTDHYLQWDSHHPVAHKLSVVRALVHQVDTHITEHCGPH